jgi:hypothetical protein
MTDAPAPVATAGEELPAGIVCRLCHGNRWKVNQTREGFALIRRFRTCLGCGHKIRTRETIEADAHPDHDAG